MHLIWGHRRGLPSGSAALLQYGGEMVSTEIEKVHVACRGPADLVKSGNFLSANDNVELSLAA